MLNQIPVVDSLPGDLVDFVPTAQRPVAHRHIADLLGTDHAARGTEVRHADGSLLDKGILRLHLIPEGLHIWILGALFAAHHDRLEVLATHQGPHTASGRGAHVIGGSAYNRGNPHQILPRRSNTGHLSPLVGFGHQCIGCLEVVLTPQVRSVAEFDPVLQAIDPQVDRFFRPTGYDQAVIAGEAQLSAPIITQIGFVPDASQR